MKIEEQREGEAVVLAPRGSLAAGAACSVLEQRLAALLQERVRFYVLDGAELTGLGSAALRALLRLQRSLRPLHGRLVFCGLDPRLRETLAVAGFERDFDVAADREEALARVRTATSPPEPPAPSSGLEAALAAALSAGQAPLDARLVGARRLAPGRVGQLRAALAGADGARP